MTRSEPSHGTRVRGARAAIVALLVVALLVLTISRLSHPTTAAAAPATAAHAVSPREFVHVIRLTGLTEAVTSYTVVVPVLAGSTRGSLTIVHLARPGSAVSTGDVLVEFDRQDQEKTAFEKDVEWRDLTEQISRKQAEQ